MTEEEKQVRLYVSLPLLALFPLLTFVHSLRPSQPWEDIYEANKAVYNAAKAEYEAKREGKGKVTNDNDGSATSPAASVSGGASGSNGGRPSSSSSATVAGETGKEKSKKAKKAVQSSSSTHTKAEHGQAFGASDRDSNGDILVNSKASGKGKATVRSSLSFLPELSISPRLTCAFYHPVLFLLHS